ncbi:MAG: CoA transferase [Alphaproteobacteria bacterium]|nr:CoA transferase [Alphaproteobacteria bacterium]
MSGPLADLKVLDLSRFVAGPFCAMMLGDMGAQVVKIEKPKTGEDIRAVAPLIDGDSLFVITYNRNKRSLTLNLRSEKGRAILRELVNEADILVENFRPGVMEAMGCDWETLSSINPRLIMARISGYGQDGPHAQRPCFDAIAQAGSGIMELTGDPDGPPTLAGTTVVDHSTGLHTVVGILAAVQGRHQSGRGQLVDVALLDSALSLLMTAIPEQAVFGEAATRMGNRDRYGAPSNSFLAADGKYVHIVAGGNPRFGRLCRAIGREDLMENPAYADNAGRRKNIEALEAVVSEWVAARGTDEIVAVMEAASVPCGPVNTIADVLANPQLRHRGQIIDVEHAHGEKVPLQGFVAKFSETPSALYQPVPSPGQHNVEILSEWLGYDESRIRDLVTADIL